MNSVYLTGTLVRVIGNRTVNTKYGDKSVVTFTLQCREGQKDEHGQYIKCEAWGAQADSVVGMQIGSFVFAQGLIKTQSWEKNGEKQYDTFVSVKNLAKMDIKAAAPKSTTQQAPQQAPQQQAPQQPAQQAEPQQQPQQELAGASTTSNDTVPF